MKNKGIGLIFWLAAAAVAAAPGQAQDLLPPCPDSPNCVSSLSEDPRRFVAPLRLEGDPQEGWARLVERVAALPRTRIVRRTDRSLDAECRSALFGFVDDLALRLDAEAGVAHVRSASRTGYWDLGVNRRRVEALREASPAAAGS